MHSDWIIDVLADLKAFAEQNGMRATAAGLEDASLVALAEIASMQVRSHGAEAQMAHGEHEHEATNVTPLFARRELV